VAPQAGLALAPQGAATPLINAKVFARSASAPMTSPDALAELVAVVARLRDPDGGCPWDLKQTHTSLIPYVLEEAHEVADAIRHGNDEHLCEELGDLLLQVVLQARIAEEEGRFDLERVARGIATKLVRRHPHVFEPHTEGQGDWETIKAQEKAERGESEASLSQRLRGKIRGQSALSGAMTISKKAAAAGFEWESMQGVWAKVHEELDELKEAVASGDRAHAQSELGDLLFTLVNVARWVSLDPEEGLAGTNRRFLDRFERVEAALGGDLAGQSIERLEGLWQRAKAELRVELREETSD
jgi:XTP/dITP diphosphohydrolase